MDLERDLELTAFETSGELPLLISKMPPKRPWMDQAPDQYPYRCLPLVIANQMGWVLVNPRTFACHWTGRREVEDLVVEYANASGPSRFRLASSHFGLGVLTFSVPYLFRTSPGYNLWVKGPTNGLKDGIAPLEGVVETDWSCATFTMNWKFTRPNHTVHFQAGEAFAMIVPFPRQLPERFQTSVKSMRSEPDVEDGYRQWSTSRAKFLGGLKVPDSDAVRAGWQKDYFQGRDKTGERFQAHQTKLNLQQFARDDSAP